MTVIHGIPDPHPEDIPTFQFALDSGLWTLDFGFWTLRRSATSSVGSAWGGTHDSRFELMLAHGGTVWALACRCTIEHHSNLHIFIFYFLFFSKTTLDKSRGQYIKEARPISGSSPPFPKPKIHRALLDTDEAPSARETEQTRGPPCWLVE